MLRRTHGTSGVPASDARAVFPTVRCCVRPRVPPPQETWQVTGCLNQPGNSISVYCLGDLVSLLYYTGQQCSGEPAFKGLTKSGACGTMPLFSSSYVVYCGDSPSPSPSPIPTPPPPWAQLGHDASRTGLSSHAGPRTNATVWTVQLGGRVYAPAIDANDHLYVGTSSQFYCVDSGGILWSFSTSVASSFTPALTQYGTVILPGGSALYSLNTTNGNIVWNTTLPNLSLSSPALTDAIVYQANYHSVYALSVTTGAVIWLFTAGQGVSGSPAVGPDGTVYFGAGNLLYAMNGSTGSVVWQLPGMSPYSSIAIDVQPESIMLYFGTADWVSGVGWIGSLFAVSAEGAVVWTQTGRNV